MIPVAKPFFDEREKEAVSSVLESGWIIQGFKVAEFEKQFAGFVGNRFAVATTSCTAALHLSLLALGVGPQDEVILPSFTFVASANAIEYVGAKPVFMDIDLQTFNMDTRELEYKVTEKSRAIMPVHLFGLCANMGPILSIARHHNLFVIEDAACAFGSYREEGHAGTFGDAGCFSFHPRKAITTGEGGMVITNDEETAAKIQRFRNHGAIQPDRQNHFQPGTGLLPEFDILGFNYRMTDIQGAIGVCQMEKAEEILIRRRTRARRYDEALMGIGAFMTPYVPNGHIHAYQAYVCLFTNGEDIARLAIEEIDRINALRDGLMERLKEKGVATRPGTHAVHALGYYKRKYNLNPEDYIKSYAAERLSITLPMYAGLTEEEQNYVIQQIKAQI